MILRSGASLVACAVLAHSAQSASQLPSFEVASIKPTPPSELGLPGGAGGGPGSTNPGQFIWTNAFLRDLILAAYDVPEPQAKGVLGLPAQAGERYNLVAKVPRGATRDQLRPMLQRLLAERFGMIAHWEQKEVPSYRLIVARGGSRLREPEIPLTPADDPAQHPTLGFEWPTDKAGWPTFPPGIPRIGRFGRKGDAMVHVTARMQTIGDLLQILSPFFDRPVVDETGLAGRYDFTLTFLPSDNSLSTSAPPASSSGQGGVSEGPNEPPPDIFAALASQLGLRLVSSKSSNRVLVIDKVNTKPTDN